MHKLFKIIFTKFGVFYTIGCFIPIVIVFFSPLLLWGLLKLGEFDDEWISEGFSSSFEKKDFFFSGEFENIGKVVIENESSFAIFTSLKSSLKKKGDPVALWTEDGGKTWNITYTNINMKSDSYIPDYLIGKEYLKNKGQIKKESVPSEDFGGLCGPKRRYAQNNRNWIVCGYDETTTSTHEVRILYKSGDEYEKYCSIPNKWHLWRSRYMKPSDFFVKDSLIVGIFDFQMTGSTLLHYLYFSIDRGKKWHNEKIPVFFSDERLFITEEKIIVLGVNVFSNKNRVEVSVLTMPIPKE